MEKTLLKTLLDIGIAVQVNLLHNTVITETFITEE